MRPMASQTRYANEYLRAALRADDARANDALSPVSRQKLRGAIVTLKVISANCAVADAFCAAVTAVVLAARASAEAAGVGALAATCITYAAHGAVSVCVYARAKEVCDVITNRDRVENDAR